MEGESTTPDSTSELVRLAARLIIEESLEGEAAEALGRETVTASPTRLSSKNRT
jgi:hypothetical protein